MQLSNTPDKLVLPFAASGGKNTIPVDSQIGLVAGKASLMDGFPPLTRTPLSAGGVPPSGLDMNGILYEMSAIIRWANAGGGYAYDSEFANDTNVNGYPKGARVMRSDGLGYWFNTTENNVTDPESSDAAASGWVPDFQSGVSIVPMVSSNVTLTPLQYGKAIIVITGVLTSNLNLIFPSIAGKWNVINNTTGPYGVTCKTASGVGVNVISTDSLTSDGTNIYSATRKGPTVTFKDFGAVGDGVADDTDAIQRAFNSRLPIFDTGGQYRIVGGDLTLYHPFNVRGAGQEMTILIFESMGGYAGSNGITVVCEGDTHAPGVMSDITFVIKGGNGKSCLYTPRGMVDSTSVYNKFQPRYYFDRLSFRGATDGGLINRYVEAWSRCIDLGDAREPVIRDCYFMGNFDKDSATNGDSADTCTTSAIYMSGTCNGIDGATTNGAVVSSLIDHCFVYYYGNAVRYVDRINQGVIRACHLNTCWNGLYSLKSPGSAYYAATEYIVSDMQIQTQRHGVYFNDGWIDINNVRSSRSGGYDTGLSWYGYRFKNVAYFKLDNFRAYGNAADSGTHYGVHWTSSDHGKISNGTIIGISTDAMDNGLYSVDSMYTEICNVNLHTVGTAVTFTTAGALAYDVKAKFVNVIFGDDVITKFNYNPLVSGKFVELNDNSFGTYIPTLFNTTNVAASTADSCMYSRVGNMVTVSLTISIDPTATSSDVVLGISLPVASDFTSSTQLAGTACEVDSGQNNACQLFADTVNDRATLKFYATDANNRIWRGSFVYTVA